jgi:hypothetical protein
MTVLFCLPVAIYFWIWPGWGDCFDAECFRSMQQSARIRSDQGLLVLGWPVLAIALGLAGTHVRALRLVLVAWCGVIPLSIVAAAMGLVRVRMPDGDEVAGLSPGFLPWMPAAVVLGAASVLWWLEGRRV